MQQLIHGISFAVLISCICWLWTQVLAHKKMQRPPKCWWGHQKKEIFLSCPLFNWELVLWWQSQLSGRLACLCPDPLVVTEQLRQCLRGVGIREGISMVFEQWRLIVVFYVIMQSTCEYFIEDRSCHCGRRPFPTSHQKYPLSSWMRLYLRVHVCVAIQVIYCAE